MLYDISVVQDMCKKGRLFSVGRLFSFDGVQSDCINAINGLRCPRYVKYFSSAFTFNSSPCLPSADLLNFDNSFFFVDCHSFAF